MSQRDVLAELRAAHVTAPPEVRERIRLIAAEAPAPPHRLFTRRRALVVAVAVPIAAAVAATVVFTRPAHRQPVAAESVLTPPSTRKLIPTAPGAAAPAFVPSTPTRVQAVATTLSLRIATANGVSDAVKRAVQIATSLSGYAASVHEQTHGKAAAADLTLKIPRAHVQQAVARLSQLGTITAERVSVTDKTAGLSATDREIARLQRALKTARAASPPSPTLILALQTHIERLQRAEAQTRLKAHYATIHLHLATPPRPVEHHGHGPLHGVVVALTWLGIGAVYALVLGAPVAILVVLVWLVVRFVRRRRVDALLSS
jgi:Domain of unknown function (DUF4349)